MSTNNDTNSLVPLLWLPTVSPSHAAFISLMKANMMNFVATMISNIGAGEWTYTVC